MNTNSTIPYPGGVLAASLTPMKPDLSIDHDRLISHVNWLLSNGCDAIAYMGTTGEANSFSIDERIRALDALAAAGIPMNALIVGNGCCAFPDTLRLTRHALEHGVAGVLLLPPFYYKGVSDEGVLASCDTVIQKLGDDRLQVYLYHFPYMSQVPFSDAVIEKLIDRYPNTIAGIKDSSGDWDHISHLIASFPSLRVFAGTERYLLDTLRAGGAGCISASVNVTAPLAAEVKRTFQEDQGLALQDSLSTARLAIQSRPMIPALKGVMARLTNDSDWDSIRPPLTPLPAAEIDSLLNELSIVRTYLAK
ncbi:MAG: dihydrodipicolinate synthase family protein [Rhodothermaceae bacterium]|nr:dihydrodipicolinate synthase family protein [Rhodothermaceae bacterium]